MQVLKNITPKVRTWLYGVYLALLPLLTSWGIISKEDAPLYAALGGALFIGGLAYANRPTNENKPTVTEAPSVILQAELDARSTNRNV